MDDLLYLEEEFGADERMMRDAVAKFVTRDVLPGINAAFEAGTFPAEYIAKCGELGIFGMTLPVAYGGAAASNLAYGLVCQELEKGDSSLRSLVSVQSSLCMYPIFQFGTEEQRQRFLPKMATGQIIGCFGLTEPGSGSDPASMHTTAQKVSGGWMLDGSKLWITNAMLADVAIVWAKTTDGIRGFLVEKDFPGFTRQEIKHKMSLRASVTGELGFNQVFVPDENYLAGSNGLGSALACLSKARFGIAFGAMGAAVAVFDITRDYLAKRRQFNGVLADKQLIQASLADMYAEILKAQCLNLQVARLVDSGRSNPVMISLIKGNACRVALQIARECRNLLGANGISLEYNVIRHMLNLESVFTYEGADNIHKLVLGKHITGRNAF